MTVEPARDHNLAATALFLGVLSLPLLWWYVLSVPVAIVAVGCGLIARQRGASSGIARAGMLCGSIALLLSAFIIILPG